MKLHRFIALFHFSYLLLTGLWPLLSMNTFIAVTGPKTDLWLVHMVGLLTVAVGVTLIYCFKRHYYKAMMILALTTCCAYAAVDIVYVMKEVIRKIYLADAVLQVTFIYNYLWVWFHQGPRLKAGGKI